MTLGGLNWSLATLPLILPSADLRVGSMLVAILNGAYFGFFITNTDLPYVQLLIIAMGITFLSIPFFSFAKSESPLYIPLMPLLTPNNRLRGNKGSYLRPTAAPTLTPLLRLESGADSVNSWKFRGIQYRTVVDM